MTAADDTHTLGALAELLGKVTETLRGGDTPEARTDAAAQVDQLRELVAGAGRAIPAGAPAGFDLARLGEALRAIAEALRTGGDREADVARALDELQAATGLPLRPAHPGRDDAAEREHYRKQASAAMDEYFRAHPHKPFKP